MTGIREAALRTFSLHLKPGDKVADLGCEHGAYTTAFARAGYDATGIEARQASYDQCIKAAAVLGLPNLRYILGDVRQLAGHGEFDGVFCCGLLYHLDYPSAFLRLLGQQTRKVLIVQSHYAALPDTVHEGRRGRWVQDHPGADDPWGSHLNDKSFWLAKTDLLQGISDAGFDVVSEQHDYRQNITAGLYIDHFGQPESDRGMFTGVKTGASSVA